MSFDHLMAPLIVIAPEIGKSEDGKEFGCAMPEEFKATQYYVGLIACEGVNRFYDFRVQ